VYRSTIKENAVLGTAAIEGQIIIVSKTSIGPNCGR
jgi:hypothetical protein